LGVRAVYPPGTRGEVFLRMVRALLDAPGGEAEP